jgi:integrase
LTDIQVKNLKARAKPKKFPDGNGLYLYLSTTGTKSWRLDYSFQSKRKTLTLGVYPDLSLRDARESVIEAKKTLRAGIDPGSKKKLLMENDGYKASYSFKEVALEWFKLKKADKNEAYTTRILGRIKKDIFPFLANSAINKISALDLLVILRRIESRGAIVTAQRCLQYCGQIFRYAIATGRASHDISADLKGALQTAQHTHFSSVKTSEALGELLRSIDSYTGNVIVKAALQMAPYVFVRPGELRHAEWAEISLDKGEWRIPEEKMKMKQTHIVPLAPQVVEILKELKYYTGHHRFLFPSMRGEDRPISDMTLLSALRRLGYSREEMTVHGFRSIASTLLNEQGYNRDWIERQLAHGERNSIRGAYNYAEYLPQRRTMMCEWANYLDSLR